MKKVARGARWSFLKLAGRLAKQLPPVAKELPPTPKVAPAPAPAPAPATPLPALKAPGTFEKEQVWTAASRLDEVKVTCPGKYQERRVRFRDDNLVEKAYIRKDAPTAGHLSRYKDAAWLQRDLEERNRRAEKLMRRESVLAQQRGWPIQPWMQVYK